MILAVSGPAFIGAVVALALVVLWVLMRGERDYVEKPWQADRIAEEEAEARAAGAPAHAVVGAPAQEGPGGSGEGSEAGEPPAAGPT